MRELLTRSVFYHAYSSQQLQCINIAALKTSSTSSKISPSPTDIYQLEQIQQHCSSPHSHPSTIYYSRPPALFPTSSIRHITSWYWIHYPLHQLHHALPSWLWCILRWWYQRIQQRQSYRHSPPAFSFFFQFYADTSQLWHTIDPSHISSIDSDEGFQQGDPASTAPTFHQTTPAIPPRSGSSPPPLLRWRWHYHRPPRACSFRYSFH